MTLKKLIISITLFTFLSIIGLVVAGPAVPNLTWSLEPENLMNVGKWVFLVTLISRGAEKITDSQEGHENCPCSVCCTHVRLRMEAESALGRVKDYLQHLKNNKGEMEEDASQVCISCVQDAIDELEEALAVGGSESGAEGKMPK